jgi:rod shape-determining protein MreD
MSATQPLSPWQWLVIPMLLCIVATVIFAVPLRIAGLRAPEPVFPVILAFAWAMIRPSMMAPFFLLLLGVFLDAFWGGPMGLWPVSLLVPYGAVLSARTLLVGQSQLMLGFWYGATVGLAMGAGFLLTALDAHATPSLVAVGWQMLATVLLYPFAYGLIDRFEDADVRFR